MTLRQNLGEFLNQVQYRHDSVVITKDGKPVAALVDIELFEKFRRLRETFDSVLAALGAAYAGVPAEQAEAEVAEALAYARERLPRET